MAFSKSFFLSLIIFIGLNIAFAIILSAVNGRFSDFVDGVFNNPLIIVVYLFGPVAFLPSDLIFALTNEFLGAINLFTLLYLISLLVSPILASIAAGKFGGNKGSSFGGWFLTTMVSAGIIIFMFFFLPTSLESYGLEITPLFLITTIISGVINGVFYCCFALLASKEELF